MASRTPLSDDDIRKILAVLPQSPLRDQALFITALCTGYRASELGAMTVGNVLGTDGQILHTVTIERRSLKGGHGAYCRAVKSRSVPLCPMVRETLGKYLEERLKESDLRPHHPLFRSRKGFGISRWQANTVIKRAIHMAGCSSLGRWGSHSARKTFCRRVYERSGKDIMLTRDAMGHSSIAVTQKYLSVDADSTAAVVLAIDEGLAA
jgi:integrase